MLCECCDKAISEARLEAVPDSTLCIDCAKAIGKYGGEFILTGVCGNIGKAGSLKKNYGDVEVHRQRNEEAIHRLREDQKGK